MGPFLTCGCQVAGPLPAIGEFHHASSNRVQDHIARDFQEMSVLLDDDRLISALEKVTGSSITVVEELGIDAVQLAHSEGEVSVLRLDEKMVVIVHEAESMA